MLCLIGSTYPILSQDLNQTVRGQIKDDQSEAPLIGANIIVVGSDPFIGASTDLDGNFRLENVPVGRQTLRITYLGYEQREIPNVLVTTGKEMVLNVSLRESIEMLSEVVIEGKTEHGESLNKMATVSARTFTVEETKRYAGAIDDPSRMASSYAGVGAVDGNNDLVIRGNSPRGMLWKMEGIEIPNPNHFSEQGASGGPISMLNSNMMGTSEFFTGAFPAEYGNGFSGVFDINLRKGNNETREYAFQVGILGTDFSAEGPISKSYNGSYLINYRYSTLSMFSLIGLDVVGDIVPKFQDLSYNIDLPTKKFGNFGLFGLGGSGSVQEDWRNEEFDYSDQMQTDMGVSGIRHSYLIGSKTLIKSVAAVTGTNRQYYQDQLDTITGNKLRDSYDSQNKDMAIRATSSVNHKFNAKNNLKVGLIYNHLLYNYSEKYNMNDEEGEVELLNSSGNADRMQAYAQWQYRMNPRLSIIPGVHYTYFPTTNEHRVEPRFGAKYQLDETSSINAGFGVHSKTWDLAVYNATGYDENGNTYKPNEKLGMLQSYHYVLGYEKMITSNLKGKVEVYYQKLNNVPIEDSDTSFVSALNSFGGFSDVPLVNKGTGENYGVEFTLEKYFTNQFFFMATSSIYNSTYVGGDGVKRNTENNGNYVNNLLFGKEWNLGSPKKVFGIGSKVVWAGGRRVTPILLAESRAAGTTVLDNSKGYDDQLQDYFRPDLQITYRINGKKASHLIKLDVQNMINRQNPWGQYYNPDSDKVETYAQVGILPVLSYKITF